MILFEQVTHDHFPIIQSLYASVPEYALLEERVLPLSDLTGRVFKSRYRIADWICGRRTRLTD